MLPGGAHTHFAVHSHTHPQTLTDCETVGASGSIQLEVGSVRECCREVSETSSATMKQKDIRPAPSLIEYKGMRFLITDRPSDISIQSYLQELRKHNVCTVVRVCEPSYDTAPLKAESISVRDLAYDDGTFPPANVVEDWFEILREKAQNMPDAAVAVHCVAGLGRAPVMVAIALIELGMKYEEAVETIRDQRRGAINAKQLSYLEKYRPKSRLKKNGHKNSCCVQ